MIKRFVGDIYVPSNELAMEVASALDMRGYETEIYQDETRKGSVTIKVLKFENPV